MKAPKHILSFNFHPFLLLCDSEYCPTNRVSRWCPVLSIVLTCGMKLEAGCLNLEIWNQRSPIYREVLVDCSDTKASPLCLGREEFPVFNLTFKWFNMMKPSPKSLGFIYKNQTQSAISDQKQQPSERGYEGRTGKAINCQSQHRSTSQSTTTITTAPLLLTCTLKHSSTYTALHICVHIACCHQA